MSIANINPQLKELSYEHVAAIDEETTDGEGWSSYESSQVLDATVYQNRISGHVGNMVEQFEVQVAIRENEIANSCTCNSERKMCVHAVTLLYAWVNDGEDFTNVADVLAEMKRFDKDRLYEIIFNIIQEKPHLVQKFLKRPQKHWDEIDPDVS